MKKIWKMKKDAVSPVIATILMVAITVVLAAVLYVMVMGFGTTGGTDPTATFTSATKATASTEKVVFSAFSKNTPPSSIKIVIENITGSQSTTFSKAGDASGALTAVTGGTLTGVASVSYTDLASDNKVSNGDYLTITFGGTYTGNGANSYKVTMIYVPSGNSIGSITFNW